MKNKIEEKDKINEDKFYANFYFLFFSLFPIIYTEIIIDPVLLPRQLILTFFLLILLLKIFFQKDFFFPTSNQLLNRGILISISGFSIITIISTFFSYNKSEAYYVTSKYFIEFVYLLTTFFLLINKKITIIVIQKSILLFTSVILFISYFQILTIYGNGEEILHNSKIIATSANKNLLSSILYLALPFIISFIRTASISKSWKLFAMFNFLSILLMVYIIQTKTVFISFIIFVLCFLTLLVLFKLIKKVKLAFSWSITIINFLLFVFTLIYGNYLVNKQHLIQFFPSSEVADQASNNEFEKNKIENTKRPDDFVKINSVYTLNLRISLWENSIQMYKDHPVIGVGPGNWQVFFPKYGLNKIDEKLTRDGFTTYQRPHNDWLWILSELGIFGVLFYIFIIVFVLIYFIAFSIRTQNFSLIITNLLFVSSIIGYLFISFADFPLERIEHQILFYTILAYGLFIKIDDLSPKLNFVRIKNYNLFVLLFMVCIYSFIVTTSRLSGEKHTRLLKIAYMRSDWNTMISEATIANNLFYKLDAMSIPIDWYKGVALFSLKNYYSALISFQNAYKENPNNIHVINDLASCYEKIKQHNKAIFFYKKALAISSGFEEARLNLCAVYFNTNRFQSAFIELKKCDSTTLNPKYKLFLPIITKKYLNLNNLSDSSITRIFYENNIK